MKLVIDIPNDVYYDIKHGNLDLYNIFDFANYIYKGKETNIEWISLTDSYPKKHGNYLCAYKNRDNSIGYTILLFVNNLNKFDKYDFPEEKGKCGFIEYDSEYGWFEWDNIIAWTKIPEYKEK